MPTTLTATSRSALAPAAGSGGSSRMAWYAAVARWAPSKHNTQPWRFIVRNGYLEFWTDPMRILASTDPYRREVLNSIGSAVHLAGVAAHAAGHEVTVSLLPDGVRGPAARINEVGLHVPTSDDLNLLAAVSKRRTERGPLDGDRLPANLPLLLRAAAVNYGSSLRLVSTPDDRLTLAGLVQRADRAPGQDRPGRDHPLVGVLTTATDTMRDWLAAGQALGAMLLRATAAGANTCYLNQPVEDFAIRSELRDQLRLDGVAQLVLRFGVGADVAATPRRDSHDLIYVA